MSNDSDLLAELKRHNLFLPLMQRRIIAEAVGHIKPSSDEIELARSQFLQSNGLKNDDELRDFLQNRGLSNSDLEWQISLPLRIKAHCKNNFEHKAEAHFLAKKNQLDRVVYSLLRTKDGFLAQELYLRIEAGEANFGDLASNFSEGPERKTRGIVGPVPMTQAHPAVAEALRVSKVGELKQPMRVGEWWLFLRIESYTPAIFDAAMAQQLSQELFDQWIKEELSLRMQKQAGLGVALKAE